MWLPYFSILSENVSPISSAASDITTYILGYGVLGVAAVLFVLRIIVPRSTVDEAVRAAREDLLKENERLQAEKTHAEEQRDEALNLAQVQLVPLLVSFTAATQSLLPLLQELVRNRGAGGRHP